MMLQGDFFTISEAKATVDDLKATLIINASHKILDGHFPNQPVVPGVCMMQMVKEIVEQVTGRKTNLIKSQEMKFLAIINPLKNNIISATLKYTLGDNEVLAVSAIFFKNELVHFKFKGEFRFTNTNL